MTILAFIPTPVLPPALSGAQRARYHSNPAYRARTLPLFHTPSRKLLVTLGHELYNRIRWEHESPIERTGWQFTPKEPADAPYIAGLLKIMDPDIVLVFTKAAHRAAIGAGVGFLYQVSDDIYQGRASFAERLDFKSVLEKMIDAASVQAGLAKINKNKSLQAAALAAE